MITTRIDSFYHFYPATTALVGAKRGRQVNFMAAAWNTGVSFDPPLFGVAISPKRFTHGMIVESGEFTCNFLPFRQRNLIHRCGRVSGRDTDKVRAFDIPLEESVRIGCPTIATAYAAYECVLRHRYPVGDHDWFVGEVVAIHADDEATREGLLDPDQVDFPLYLGRNTYLTTDPATRIVLPDDPDRLRE